MNRQASGEAHAVRCGAHGRQKQRPCRNPAGFRTDHLGSGRCFLHGGRSPITTGRHSQVILAKSRLKELVAEHLANPDPLNTLPELAKARALADDFLDRYEDFSSALLSWHASYKADPESDIGKPTRILDVADATRILSEITKIVERIERARAANAISRSDLLRVVAEFARVVEAYVADPKVLDKIRAGWMAVRVA